MYTARPHTTHKGVCKHDRSRHARWRRVTRGLMYINIKPRAARGKSFASDPLVAFKSYRPSSRHRKKTATYHYTARIAQATIYHRTTTTMEHQPIVIPNLSKTKFSAWVAPIRLQAGALRLTQAMDDANCQVDLLRIHSLASFTNAVLDSISVEAQIEAIDSNLDLQLHHLLHHIHT